MTKIFLVALLALMLVLTACGGGPGSAPGERAASVVRDLREHLFAEQYTPSPGVVEASKALCERVGEDDPACISSRRMAESGQVPEVINASGSYRAANEICRRPETSSEVCEEIWASAGKEVIAHEDAYAPETQKQRLRKARKQRLEQTQARECLPLRVSFGRAGTLEVSDYRAPGGTRFNAIGRGPEYLTLDRIPSGNLGDRAWEESVNCLETFAHGRRITLEEAAQLAGTGLDREQGAVYSLTSDPPMIRIQIGEFEARMYGSGPRFRFGPLEFALEDGEKQTLTITGHRDDRGFSQSATAEIALRRNGGTVRFCDPLAPDRCASAVAAALREGDIVERRVSLPVAFGGGLQQVAVRVEIVRGEPLPTERLEILRQYPRR